eukprot:3766667-Pyramimonas_sp.AAC.1
MSKLGHSCEHPRRTSAVEIDKHCQAELLEHPGAPECLFGDIVGFLSENINNKLKDLKSNRALTLDDLSTALWRETGKISGMRKCICHDAPRCRFKVGRLHIAGTPCIDFSPKGLRATVKGKTLNIFVAWVALMRCSAPALIIDENSHLFSVDILQDSLGDMYIICATIICPSSLGWPVRRPRRWALLASKQK